MNRSATEQKWESKVSADCNWPDEDTVLHDRHVAVARQAAELASLRTKLEAEQKSDEFVMPRHGFIPDPLIDHDAPICELCGEAYRDRNHDGYARFVKATDKEIVELTTRLEAAEAKGKLADEVVTELKTRERLSSVEPLMFPRLTVYEISLIARYDACSEAAQESSTEPTGKNLGD